MDIKDTPYIIAGPCSAESEDQVMRTARGLKAVGIGVFRAGIWKPRTRPGNFEGVGEKGLPWLQRVRDELGMRVCTEVASTSHVEACLEAGLDMVWIGARTSTNPFLVQELADALSGTGIHVMVKNPINADMGLWIGAIERLQRRGVEDFGLVHRGVSSFENTRYRNSPQWSMAAEMRRLYPGVPFLCDPSHMGGNTEYIPEISQRALDLGLDGLMIESHCCPSCALSDAHQQITPEELGRLIAGLYVRDEVFSNPLFERAVAEQRARIDTIDENLVRLLASRMEVSREIGRLKKENNVAVLQLSRWDDVLDAAINEGQTLGMDPAFVRDVFNAIHSASIAEQNSILQDNDSKN